MAMCLKQSSQTYYILDYGFDKCNFYLVSNAEYDALNAYTNGVTIDPVLYTTVSGWILLSFVSGHVLGRILKTMGKS